MLAPIWRAALAEQEHNLPSRDVKPRVGRTMPRPLTYRIAAVCRSGKRCSVRLLALEEQPWGGSGIGLSNTTEGKGVDVITVAEFWAWRQGEGNRPAAGASDGWMWRDDGDDVHNALIHVGE